MTEAHAYPEFQGKHAPKHAKTAKEKRRQRIANLGYMFKGAIGMGTIFGILFAGMAVSGSATATASPEKHTVTAVQVNTQKVAERNFTDIAQAETIPVETVILENDAESNPEGTAEGDWDIGNTNTIDQQDLVADLPQMKPAALSNEEVQEIKRKIAEEEAKEKAKKAAEDAAKKASLKEASSKDDTPDGQSGADQDATIPTLSDYQTVVPEFPTPQSSPNNAYPWGQCTWWAFERRMQLNLPANNHFGNAKDWAASAVALGYQVDHEPQAGAIIVFAPGQAGAHATYGHVGVVEGVAENGTITISESNTKGLGVINKRTLDNASKYVYVH